MVIKRQGLKHISKLVKKVTKKAKAPKVDKLKTKIYNAENRLQQDSPYLTSKTINKESKEILEMKKEYMKLTKGKQYGRHR